MDRKKVTLDKGDFSQGKISKVILRLALPMTMAQLVNVLYSLISKIYLGRLPGAAYLAISGVGVTLPIIFIVVSVSALFSSGGGPLFAIARGKGDEREAEGIIGNSFTLLLIFGAVLTAAVLIFMTPLLFLFGASENIYPFAREYLTIYSLGSIFVMMSTGMNTFINAQGFGRVAMMSTILGASVNLVLEPIMIFALDMGVRGAALSTVAAQFTSSVWVMWHLIHKLPLRIKLSRMRLMPARVRKILTLGLSGFTMALTSSLTQIVANIMLRRHGGDMYIGIMAIINALREAITMPFFGLERGASPVVSFNYGAKLYDRVREAIKFKFKLAVTYAGFVSAIILLFPGLLLRAFSSDAELIAAGIPAMRIYLGLFVFLTFHMSSQTVFVGLGKAKHAIFFALLRKAFIVAPLTILLPMTGLGTYGVFVAEASAQFISGIACFTAMYVLVYRKLKKAPELL